jgi:hypothetical protein
MIITEPKRLALVKQYHDLTLNENKELNDLVALAAKICNVNMSCVSLIDEHVQWVKCALGITADEQSREDSFCKYLVNTTKVMVVKNTLLDERFMNYNSVRAPRGIRFYAGVSIITSDGYHLGALCVYGSQPQTLSTEQKEMLAFIARQVMHMLEMLLGIKSFKQNHVHSFTQKKNADAAERKLNAILNSSPTSHILINKALQVLHFNNSSSVLVKKHFSKRIEAGKNVLQYISTPFKGKFLQFIKRAFTGKKISKEVLIKTAGEAPQWWDISLHPVTNDQGDTVSVTYSASNINEQKLQAAQNEMQKDSLLKIAFIQSHSYRKPVASILGLMNVIKANNYKSPKESLLLMEIAVKDLDAQIRSVVDYADKAS